MKKKLLFVLAMILAATGITALIGVAAKGPAKKEGKRVVTSFYPVYLLTQKVVEGAKGVEVWNLTSNHSGCLHDYTLKTQDMRLLSEAELFLINGGGMELFLEKAAKECKGLKIIDTSEGFEFLAGVEHHHDHGAEEDEHDHEGHDHVDEDHDHEAEDHDHEEESHNETEDPDHGELNAHLWLDVDGYLLQLTRIETALCEMDPAQEELYHRNAANYREELMRLRQDYADAKALLSGRDTVVFHEGFVYLLNMLGIETLHCLPMDSETQISAGEAAEIIEECALHGVTVLFATEDYAEMIQRTFGTETGCRVVALHAIDSSLGALGKYGETEGYLDLMRENLNRIKVAYGMAETDQRAN